jgi:uncharacterized membrane protein YvbJ
MFCASCGNKISIESKFCSGCGSLINRENNLDITNENINLNKIKRRYYKLKLSQ